MVIPSRASSTERSSSAVAAALMSVVVSPLKASWKVPDIGADAVVVTRCSKSKHGKNICGGCLGVDVFRRAAHGILKARRAQNL